MTVFGSISVQVYFGLILFTPKSTHLLNQSPIIFVLSGNVSPHYLSLLCCSPAIISPDIIISRKSLQVHVDLFVTLHYTYI